MRASDLHLEDSSFRFLYFVMISFMSKGYISQLFPPQMYNLFLT